MRLPYDGIRASCVKNLSTNWGTVRYARANNAEANHHD